MQQVLTEIVMNNPLLIASVAASLSGAVVYFLYKGFITQNYQRIKWFRRLLLPHISLILRQVDKNNKDVDLSKLYVQTEILEDKEHIGDLYLGEGDKRDEVVGQVGDYLIESRFRPEVILTPLAEHEDDLPEVGNFVLTAPNRNRDVLPGYGVFTEIFRMLTSKYQLHIRMYYDKEKHRLRFYGHYELNPYNPLYAKKHFNSVDYDSRLGVKIFRRDYAEKLSKYGIEWVRGK
jgi:hypothetical protein